MEIAIMKNATYVKGSTKKGMKLLEKSASCCWNSLHSLYDTWSDAKDEAFDECYLDYLNTDMHLAFGVGNANTFSFTASWLGKVTGGEYDGEEACFIKTKKNLYIVLLNV